MIWLEKENGRADGGRKAFAKGMSKGPLLLRTMLISDAEVMDWLRTKDTFNRTLGRDHYITAIAWDKGRRPFGDINLLGPETPTNFQDLSSFSLDKYMHGLHDLVIP